MKNLLRVIIVEDSVSDANLVIWHLQKDGFVLQWRRVEDEEELLDAIQQDCDLVLSDWNLPGFSGLRALQIIREQRLDVPFIIISGNIGEEAAVDALHQGASDYLLKDRLERLGQAVRHALKERDLRLENEQAEKMLQLQSTALNAAANAIMITDRSGKIEWANAAFTTLTGFAHSEAIGQNTRDLLKSGRHDLAFYQDLWQTILAGKVWRGEMINRRKNGEIYYEEQTITPVKNAAGEISQFIAIKQDATLRKQAEERLRETSVALQIAYDATLQGWSRALELREHETAGHSQRVVETTLELSRAMGIAEGELVHFQRGALLHDIGKMGIPDSILLKPGKLAPDEWEIMRQHPVYAYNLLAPIPYLAPALGIPYEHHEHWDGGGYPRGLRGEQISLAARVFAVVDVWDALSYDRPYRKAWPLEKVMDYIQDLSGKQFDPRVVDVFLGLLKAGQRASSSDQLE
jgi:PAS domain S-box-containing protein